MPLRVEAPEADHGEETMEEETMEEETMEEETMEEEEGGKGSMDLLH